MKSRKLPKSVVGLQLRVTTFFRRDHLRSCRSAKSVKRDRAVLKPLCQATSQVGWPRSVRVLRAEPIFPSFEHREGVRVARVKRMKLSGELSDKRRIEALLAIVRKEVAELFQKTLALPSIAEKTRVGTWRGGMREYGCGNWWRWTARAGLREQGGGTATLHPAAGSRPCPAPAIRTGES